MRRNQQINSRRLASTRNRKLAAHRRLKREWLAKVVQPLQRTGTNTRVNRRRRRWLIMMGR